MGHLEGTITNFTLIQIEVGVKLEIKSIVALLHNLLVGKSCLEEVFVFNVLLEKLKVLLVLKEGIVNLLKIHVSLEDQVVQLGLVWLPVCGIVTIVLGFGDGVSQNMDLSESLSKGLEELSAIIVVEGLNFSPW
jgi:hypothetical protein